SLLGFEKKDANEPKGPWERFAATAGAGLSQALSNANEWLPQMMEANRARAQQQQAMMMAQQRGLPPGAQQQRRPVGPQGQPVGPPPGSQPEVQRVRPQRRRGAQWAAEGVSVGAQNRPTSEPLGFQNNPDPEPTQTAVRESVAPQANPEQVQSVESVSEDAPVTNGNSQIQFPERFRKFFPDEALYSFLQQTEQAVNNHVDPAGFATLMIASYADGAAAMVQNFQPTDLEEAVTAIPGTETSALLRREGQRWMEKLWVAIGKQLAERKPAQSAQTSA